MTKNKKEVVKQAKQAKTLSGLLKTSTKGAVNAGIIDESKGPQDTHIEHIEDNNSKVEVVVKTMSDIERVKPNENSKVETNIKSKTYDTEISAKPFNKINKKLVFKPYKPSKLDLFYNFCATYSVVLKCFKVSNSKINLPTWLRMFKLVGGNKLNYYNVGDIHFTFEDFSKTHRVTEIEFYPDNNLKLTLSDGTELFVEPHISYKKIFSMATFQLETFVLLQNTQYTQNAVAKKNHEHKIETRKPNTKS